VNAKDFYDWKRHPVTQIILSQLGARVSEIKDILGERAGQDSAFDREMVGAIKAYNDLITITFEDSGIGDSKE
jgi:hypothetical protein